MDVEWSLNGPVNVLGHSHSLITVITMGLDKEPVGLGIGTPDGPRVAKQFAVLEVSICSH